MESKSFNSTSIEHKNHMETNGEILPFRYDTELWMWFSHFHDCWCVLVDRKRIVWVREKKHIVRKKSSERRAKEKNSSNEKMTEWEEVGGERKRKSFQMVCESMGLWVVMQLVYYRLYHIDFECISALSYQIFPFLV